MTERTKSGRGKIIAWVAAGVLGALVLGCESDGSSMADFFPSGERRPQVFADAHAEAGARSDATLHTHHFDESELNSLGRQKLDLMTRGREDRTVTVYMNFSENDGMEARRDAVTAHLQEKGFDEGMLRFVAGPNPNTNSPAAGHLLRMERTEGAGGAGDAASTTYLPAPMTGGANR